MKIFIDIGHPAHVHYFKNFIKIMTKKGHTFLITARDKEVTHTLLKSYDIDYESRGKGSKGIFGKVLYSFKAVYIIRKLAKSFKPDFFLSFSSPYAAIALKLYGRPHIAFDDTEHARLGHLSYRPFTDIILSPRCYKGKLHPKQILFESYMELSYLHPNIFTPNPEIFKEMNINESDTFIIVRFVSWDASHDIGYSGFDLQSKIDLVNELTKYGKVFISSEAKLPDELAKFELDIRPHMMHDALNYASLFIGEGATMASEACMLGTPSIYTNNLKVGTIEEQKKKYNLVYETMECDQILKISDKILKNKNLHELKLGYKKMIGDKINLTEFLVSFVESNFLKKIK